MKKVDWYEEVLGVLKPSDIEEVYEESLDVSEPDDFDDYLLNTACRLQQYENVEFFISRGADLNSIGRDSDTPLITTIDHYHHDPDSSIKIVKTLIDHGADLEKKGMFSKTAFIMACTRGCLEVIELLVAKGCDFNATVKEFGNEENGLEYAYRMQVSRECIKYLKKLYKIA